MPSFSLPLSIAERERIASAGYTVRWTSAFGRALAARRATKTEAYILAAWLRRLGFDVSIEED